MGRIENKVKHRRPVSETAAPSRGQRKRGLKKASLLRKKGLVGFTQRVSTDHEAVRGPRGENLPYVLPKKAVGGGDALSIAGVVEGRPDPRLPDQPTRHRVISNKGKKTLVATELGQLFAVLATPSFQQDPFEAVQAHLRQTACPTPTSFDRPRDSRGSKATNTASKYERPVGRNRSSIREDKRQKSRAFKGRNAKMRVKR